MAGTIMPGILNADDNHNIRYLLRVFVETQTSFRVCGEAVNGADAIEKAQQLRPELILFDLSMPLMTGIEAAPVLQRMLPETKIILFTLYADYIPKSLIAVAGSDLALSKAEGIVGLAAHLNSLLVPRLPLPELAGDSLGGRFRHTGSDRKTDLVDIQDRLT
jgi:DNA-binding NarL/FixJ family response regulator